MKPATLALRNTIKQEHSIKVQPRLITEWEYNRFFSPTVTVTPSQSGDDTWNAYFGNLGSIVEPFRPAAGIAKARADSNVRPEGKYRDKPNSTRYYPSYEYDQYMYWSSLQRSQLTVTGGSYQMDTPISVTSIYPQSISVNKIVAGFETGYAKPISVTIQITTDGTTWTTISNNPIIASDGTVTIWHTATGWNDTPTYDLPVVIQGVRLNVYSLSQPYCHVDILQLSPRLENDLTPYIIDYDIQSSVSSPTFIAPLGKASTNTASITLSNIDQRFNNENLDSLYYHMIEKKVRFKLDLGIDTTAQGGAGLEYVREFTGWSDTWASKDNSSITVSLKDSSVILQEQNMPPVFFENATVGAIVWSVLDRIGMTSYAYTRNDTDNGQVIPFYWPSDTSENSNPRWGRLKVSNTLPPNTTIWDEFAAMAESTQTAIFFDEYDVLQIVSRKTMYDNGKPVNWNLDAVQNGTKLPDVVAAQTTYDLTTNQVEITYKPCAYSNDDNGFPQMATVWQPAAPVDMSIVPNVDNSNTSSTDVVLRASALVRDLSINGTDLWINQPEAVFWPWESDVNIEGEVLHYLGKEYAYYDASNVLQKTVVTSLTQQQTLDKLSATLHWKNSFTGRLVVTNRGLYGSVATSHTVTGDNSYTSLLTSYDNGTFAPFTGYITQKAGYITQSTPVTSHTKGQWYGTYHLRKHGTAVTPPAGSHTVWYGAKIRFPSGYSAPPTNPSSTTQNLETSTPTTNWKIGGLFFAGDWGDAGYFLEVTPTGQIDGWENRSSRNELCLVGMPGNAAAFAIAGTNAAEPLGKNDSSGNPILTRNFGFKAGILEDTWYQIDISYSERASDGNKIITIYLNGVIAGTWNIPPAQQPGNYTNQWRFGTHVRGPSTMDIEYLYAVGEDDTNPYKKPDQTSFLDLVTGGYASGFVAKNIKYNYASISPAYRWPGHTPYVFPQNVSQSHMILDEYGPVVHEVRSFDVAFNVQTVPVSSSFLYVSNPLVEVMSYQSDAFGANFMLANAGRTNVIVNGQDDITYGSANSLNQTLLVYGRCVYTAQNDYLLIKKDDDAIRRQGLIRTQFTTRYIQTTEMADEIGSWVVALWATGVDEVAADLFGNPLLQIGDLVTMNFPSKGMAPSTHQYFITDIKSSFSSGYKTSVTLRRAHITSS